ncbi:hypothetical protein QBC46DRAFT_276645 [Diplogelasinospora grovesii]|uniref:Mitochondrial outer membrane protein n=1 Tax=Diplogelasinospora grovesii TaxID=303347 RepID=A0AAN6NHX5_9PEZI|nr:hypothetical protein QBC46DRAFT_276645 [Diplogelasinospora grovesii]
MSGTKWMPVPRPLQSLFDRFPLVTYDANDLPARSPSHVHPLLQPHTSSPSNLPTLYVFISEDDAVKNAPSFNPGCLKWQTFLKLAGVEFHVLPSTNHASPTGALPFLLPSTATTPSTTTNPASTDPPSKPTPPTEPSPPNKPVPSSRLYTYALNYHTRQNPQQPQQLQPPASLFSDLPRKSEAYQSLLDLSIRNAWLYTLYLCPQKTHLLDALYVRPTSTSTWVQATTRHQLRRAAETEILKSTSTSSTAGVVNPKAVYREARLALEALAIQLGTSDSGWFFGAEQPTLFDASVFAYTYLMLKYLGGDEGDREGSLGAMVRNAGKGELAAHCRRLTEMLWPELSSELSQ